MKKIIFIVALFTSLLLLAKDLDHNSMKNVAIKMLKSRGNDFDISLEDGAKPVHGIVGYYNITDSKNETMLITQTHPSTGGDCHACGVIFSFFMFKDGKLQNSNLNSIEIGSYGEAPKSSELKIVKLKDDVLALFWKSFAMAQGYEGDFLSIYNISDKKPSNILNFRLSMNNEPSGAKPIEKWNSTYNLDKDSNIIQQISGTKDGKAFSKEIIYKFNGQKYEK
jgi:hypothetical protein